MKFILSCFLLQFCLSIDSFAADFSQTSASILYGKNYSSASDLSKKDDILTLTMEHYSTWEYGDNFFFLDIYNLDDGNNFNASPPKVDGTRDFYFEWQPRISIRKFLENIDMISWSIRDYGLSTQINVPVVNGESYLLGPYIDFNLSDNDFLQTNYLIKDTRGVGGVSFQLSLVWFARFFNVFVFTGFADFATSEGEKASEGGYLASSAIAQPQLLYDFGSLQIGMEWYYWKNKFGVEGTVDSVFSPIIKWIF